MEGQINPRQYGEDRKRAICRKSHFTFGRRSARHATVTSQNYSAALNCQMSCAHLSAENSAQSLLNNSVIFFKKRHWFDFNPTPARRLKRRKTLTNHALGWLTSHLALICWVNKRNIRNSGRSNVRFHVCAAAMWYVSVHGWCRLFFFLMIKFDKYIFLRFDCFF